MGLAPSEGVSQGLYGRVLGVLTCVVVVGGGWWVVVRGVETRGWVRDGDGGMSMVGC